MNANTRKAAGPFGKLASAFEAAARAQHERTGNSFALVVARRIITTEGDWRQSDRLRSYANSHQGTYIVLTKEGDFLLETDPSVISQAVT